MSWTQYQGFVAALARSYDKRIRVYTKDNLFSRICAWFLFIISLGQLSREMYLTKASTCFANYHFYPKEKSLDSVLRSLPHEARHTRQFTVLGFGIHPLLGYPLALVIYAFLLLPAGLAIGRLLMELDADKATWRYILTHNNNIEGYHTVRWKAKQRAESLSGAMYLFAVPHKLSSWLYTRAVQGVIDEFKAKLG